MRKIFKYFNLIIAVNFFISLTAYTQDTLQFIGGRKIITKVIDINDTTLNYSIPESVYLKKMITKKRFSPFTMTAGIAFTRSYGSNWETYSILSSSSKTAFNFSIGYKINKLFSVQANLIAGNLYGKSKETYSRYFESEFNEISLTPLLKLSGLINKPSLSPDLYLKAGIGLFNYRSILRYTDSSKYISSYGYYDNGDGKEKMLNTFTFPLGLGINLRLSPHLDFNVEYLYKFTNTNKLNVTLYPKKNDKFGTTAFSFTYKFGQYIVKNYKSAELTDLYYYKTVNQTKVITYKIDTLTNYYLVKIKTNKLLFALINNEINKLQIEKMGEYVEGQNYAVEHYRPFLSTAGSVLAGLSGGYLAFWGATLPALYVITTSSTSPSIYNESGKLIIPENKAKSGYFIRGFKDRARRTELKNSVVGGISGLLVMILIKSIHSR
ncbi:MAG: outer membrane beta-barrel protein [Bacteroidales bacterium]|nr:outer membrane beta-barrel protein [Bacteroidales bacterium]